MKWRKFLVVVICIFVLMSLFAGCGSKQSSTNGEKTSEPEKKQEESTPVESPKEPVKLHVLTWRNEDAEVFAKLNKMFEDSNPNIKIDMQITTSDTAEYYSILKTRIMGQQDLDIFSVHPGSYLNEYANSSMQDITGTPVTKDIMPSMLEAGSVGGKVYAIPQAQNSTLIFYNKKIFEKYNLTPPKTWAEFLNIIDTLNANNVAPMSVGMADTWTTIWLFDNVQGGLTDDVKIFEKLGKEVQFTDPEFADVFKGLQELGKHNFTQKDAIGTKYEASLALFAQEKTAMLDTGTWSVGGLKQQNPDLQMGFFAMPSPNDKITVQITPAQAFGIYNKSKNPDEAMKYLEFLFSKEALEIYGNETGQLVTRTDVTLSVPELNEVSAVLSQVKTVPQLRLYSPNTKIDGDILPAASVKAILGEDVDKIISEAQAQLEQVINE
ncbi:MAG TPA: extracellular solute-binding protein [Clostridiaceae bacterium]|nr:extracellular solute-binding protein [Clostridiaceae bacterium]